MPSNISNSQPTDRVCSGCANHPCENVLTCCSSAWHFLCSFVSCPYLPVFDSFKFQFKFYFFRKPFLDFSQLLTELDFLRVGIFLCFASSVQHSSQLYLNHCSYHYSIKYQEFKFLELNCITSTCIAPSPQWVHNRYLLNQKKKSYYQNENLNV